MSLMRWDIINHLIKKNNYKSYLEVGYYKGWSFDRVECDQKTAVDPNPCKTPEQENWISGSFHVEPVENLSFIVKKTSDQFFVELLSDKKYDIIFIDGLHESSQVDKDIQNALKHLNPGGTIVMHDCSPDKYELTTTGIDGCWTGDVYKSFINFTTGGRCDFYVVDTDYGVGVIQNYVGLPQSMKLDYQWLEFDIQRKQLLNLISPEEFLEREKINQTENA